jgi:hypothetical protein
MPSDVAAVSVRWRVILSFAVWRPLERKGKAFGSIADGAKV